VESSDNAIVRIAFVFEVEDEVTPGEGVDDQLGGKTMNSTGFEPAPSTWRLQRPELSSQLLFVL